MNQRTVPKQPSDSIPWTDAELRILKQLCSDGLRLTDPPQITTALHAVRHHRVYSWLSPQIRRLLASMRSVPFDQLRLVELLMEFMLQLRAEYQPKPLDAHKLRKGPLLRAVMMLQTHKNLLREELTPERHEFFAGVLEELRQKLPASHPAMPISIPIESLAMRLFVAFGIANSGLVNEAAEAAGIFVDLRTVRRAIKKARELLARGR